MGLYLASFDSCDFVTFGSLSLGVAIKTFSDMVVSDMCGLVIQARPVFVELILNPQESNPLLRSGSEGYLREAVKKRVHAATHPSAKHNVLEVVRNTMQVSLPMEVRACRLPVHSCYHYRGRLMNATGCVLQSRALTHRTLRSFGRFERCERCPGEPPSVIHMAESHL